jgi:hypothetical protein
VLYSLITLGILTLLAVGVYAVDTTQAWHNTSQIDFSSSGITIGRYITTGEYITAGGYISSLAGGEDYKQTSLVKWGLISDGDMYIEPANGKNLYLTDQWSRTGQLNIQFGSVVSGSGISAPSFIYSSDRTLKENILPLTNSLEKVEQLQGVSFDWKESGDESIGLIAQDVEKIFPELVSTNSEGLKSVEYGNLVAVLIEAVKEQQKQIDSLQEQINKLSDK